jgi:hypothetical protein
MKKAAFLTVWIMALAITCTFAQSNNGSGTGKGSDTTRIYKKSSVKHTKMAMHHTVAKKTDTVSKGGRALTPDGTDPIGTGNNGTGGSGTGNLGNGGVGTGKPSGTGGSGTGSGVKVKP